MPHFFINPIPGPSRTFAIAHNSFEIRQVKKGLLE